MPGLEPASNGDLQIIDPETGLNACFHEWHPEDARIYWRPERSNIHRPDAGFTF
jgi:hypothetical protein